MIEDEDNPEWTEADFAKAKPASEVHGAPFAAQMVKPLFLIWSEEHGAWWRPGRWGYTQRIREAGQYPKAIADEIVAGANFAPHIFNEIAVPVPPGIPPME